MKVVTLPASLNERTFDAVVRGLEGETGERRLFEGSHLRWIDPYGMLGLLAVGTLAARSGEMPILRLPGAATRAGPGGRLTRRGGKLDVGPIGGSRLTAHH